MRTIFVRVTSEASPSYAPVLATPITSTTFSIDSVHPDFTDAALEFGAGDSVRCKTVRAAGTRRVGRKAADGGGGAGRLSRSRQLLKPALSR
jgi:hypothetical protein